MSSRHRFWVVCVLVLACLGRAQAAIQVGEKFPSLDAVALEGGSIPDTADKVTLIDFWASWCAPCKMSFPVYAQLYASYQSHGFVIVAVSADENQAAFDAFVRKQSPPFTTLRDTTHQLANQVMVPAMPTCYLLGRDGRVRFVHRGFHGSATDQELREEIDSLLAHPSSPP